jgi:hypothetical protein
VRNVFRRDRDAYWRGSPACRFGIGRRCRCHRIDLFTYELAAHRQDAAHAARVLRRQRVIALGAVDAKT